MEAGTNQPNTQTSDVDVHSNKTLKRNYSIPIDSSRTRIALHYDEAVFESSQCIDSKTPKVFQRNRNAAQLGYIAKEGRSTDDTARGQHSADVPISSVFTYGHDLLRRTHWFRHYERSVRCPMTMIEKRNVQFGRVFDFLLGLIVMYHVFEYKGIVLESFRQSTEHIIDGLKQALNVLMDSPAGLKLNYALNHTLAMFFFYHISLWRLFVEGIFRVSPHVAVVTFALLGSLGLSYQLALLADVITFLTFHVYCIYVYAATFYRLQIYTIVALWRLFIGRKYNPLKERVDSFEYSHNQLSIGTLGFTIVLFLLPTTCLYYIVFTMFRVCVLTVCKCVTVLATYLSSSSLYLRLLRFTAAKAIRGSFRLIAIRDRAAGTLRLHCTWDVCNDCPSSPYPVHDEGISMRSYLQRICTGKLF